MANCVMCSPDTISLHKKRKSNKDMRCFICLLAVLIVAFSIEQLIAFDCKVIEYEDRDEAVCEGEATTQVSNGYARNMEIRSNIYSEIPKYQSPSDIKFIAAGYELSGLVVMASSDNTRDGNSKFKTDFKCDVYSESLDNIVVTIVGKNRDGFEVISLDIIDAVKNGKHAVITGSKTIPAQQYYDSLVWEPQKLSANDTVLPLRQSSGDIYTGINSNSTARNDTDLIVMKKGVKFPHNDHKSSFSCSKCHGASTGTIEGFGKDYAHKTCKGCHAEMQKGPTGCKECHK